MDDFGNTYQTPDSFFGWVLWLWGFADWRQFTLDEQDNDLP